MAYIDKLLSKFNKAQNKVNSFKGIVADFKSIKYDSVTDTLDQDGVQDARDAITARNTQLNQRVLNKDSGKVDLTTLPTPIEPQMIYPYHDKLANYIVFNIRPRKKREQTPMMNVHKDMSVALYVPDTLISQASATYRGEGISIFNRAILNVLEKASGLLDFETIAAEAAPVVGAGLQQFQNKISGGLLNVSRGVAINPQQEQIFDGVPFRSWDFTFDFYAKSEEEAQEIRNIIYTFRSSMLPDVTALRIIAKKDPKTGKKIDGMFDIEEAEDGKFKEYSKTAIDTASQLTGGKDSSIRPFYNLPNIIDIEFAGPMGSKVDGFLPAVLSNVQVDYTGGQKFSTFYDGMPSHIQLTLNFAEIKVMTLGNYDMIKASAVGDSTFGSTDSLSGDSIAFERNNAAVNPDNRNVTDQTLAQKIKGGT